MKRDDFTLPLLFPGELIIDNFAGGGGTSTGLEAAFGRPVDIAINHDPEALAMHAVNHPHTTHLCESVWDVDPIKVTGNQPVGLVWLSPDCKHFSKAKGGTPVEKKIRGLAWVALRWAAKCKPRVIALENVEEFKTWGPLQIAADGTARPDPARKGKTFESFVRQLQGMGYVVDWRELRACDFGAPTIRKRFFLVARRDHIAIAWPKPSHGAPTSKEVKAGKLLPWRTAAECIDWSIPCPSIFERKRPLAEATLRRVAKGVMRYVVNAAEPYIVGLAHREHTERAGGRSHGLDEPIRTVHAGGGNHALVVPTLAPFLTEHANASNQRVFSADEPLRTQVAQVKGGHFALVAPTLVQTGYGERPGQSPRTLDLQAPLGTVVSGQKHALVSAFLAQHNNHRGTVPSDGRPVTAPVSTLTTKGAQQTVVAAHLVHMGHGEGKDGKKRFSHGIRHVTEPLNTVAASGMPAAVVTSNLVKLRGTSTAQASDEPLHTVSAGGTHFAEVRAFLIAYYGSDQDPRLEDPMHTVTTKHRFGLVTVQGEEYAIVDIGLRMLSPRELYNAQGFPADYQIEAGPDGKPFTKTAQVRMCGNSVCPPLAEALIRANFAHEAQIYGRAAA
ncbi:DNA cytosine methyltransferase [Variovorax ginsengisoli]|uniref:DNA (cytosine-5-)-methyltransferase n=1 Tax=Variovorax ginsengisoli TaxID=363844 RepID=A0ABT8SDK0_9BURK|nr:DNA cytosine methyltransferase [Variovorax ginsengisoli]MDN8617816.1 DNA cytosine methyltransferase [Variovorax ginsengisoli]MDO1536986.1 DNA cytosine methyltransferase [Variovorax ginsengisoli]